jgi:hypothetical protein
MTGDHHGRLAGRATLLARAADEIFGSDRVTHWRLQLLTGEAVSIGMGDRGPTARGSTGWVALRARLSAPTLF